MNELTHNDVLKWIAIAVVSLLLIVAVIYLVIFLIKKKSTSECKLDSDCASGQICTDGTCVGPSGPTGCKSSSDCAAGQVCNSDGNCVTGPTGPSSKCTKNSDCLYGQVCNTGDCVTGPPGPSECNPPCSSGQICLNNQCVVGCNGNGTIGQDGKCVCANGFAGTNCENYTCNVVFPRCKTCSGTNVSDVKCTETIDDTLFDLNNCVQGPYDHYGCPIRRNTNAWSPYTGVYCHGIDDTGRGNCHGGNNITYIYDPDHTFQYCQHPDFTKIDPSTYIGLPTNLQTVDTTGLGSRSVSGLAETLSNKGMSILSETSDYNKLFTSIPPMPPNYLLNMVVNASGQTLFNQLLTPGQWST